MLKSLWAAGRATTLGIIVDESPTAVHVGEPHLND